MGKIIYAFLDGFLTGLDPVGCLVGYTTEKNQGPEELIFTGHVADKYSLTDPVDTDSEEEFVPKQRSLDEQIAKAFGDVAGLGTNIVTCGIPQLYLGLAMPAFKKIDQINNKILVKKLRETYEQSQ